MKKYGLIFCAFYIAFQYAAVSSAGDADEHVHIKLLMSNGGRKQIHHARHHYHSKKHPKFAAAVAATNQLHHYHRPNHHHHHHTAGQHVNHVPPPMSYHQQHEIHAPTSGYHLNSHLKKLPTSDQIIDTSDAGAYTREMATNFALFPQPTTYETEIEGQQHLESFSMSPINVDDTDIKSFMASGEDFEDISVEHFPAHHYSSRPKASALSSNKNALQTFMEQQYNSPQLEGFSSRDIKTHRPPQLQHDEAPLKYAFMADGKMKALSLDDIWSQLQKTYLNKYASSSPQSAHPLAGTTDSVLQKAKKSHRPKSNKIQRQVPPPQTLTSSYPNSYTTSSHYQNIEHYPQIHSQEHHEPYTTQHHSANLAHDIEVYKSQVARPQYSALSAAAEESNESAYETEDSSSEESIYSSGNRNNEDFSGSHKYRHSEKRTPNNYGYLPSYSTPGSAEIGSQQQQQFAQPLIYGPFKNLNSAMQNVSPSQQYSVASYQSAAVPHQTIAAASYEAESNQWPPEQSNNYATAYQQSPSEIMSYMSHTPNSQTVAAPVTSMVQVSSAVPRYKKRKHRIKHKN